MALQGIQYHPKNRVTAIVKALTITSRTSEVVRTTKETEIRVKVDLDESGGAKYKRVWVSSIICWIRLRHTGFKPTCLVEDLH